MKKKKITFSEPNCRFGCPHFKSVGSVLNETCYCMKKGKKGRRLGKKDLKRRPPEWCPRRLKTPVCRIYGFKDEMHEALELDNRLNFEPDKHDWYFPSSHHYQLQSEFPLGMTAEQFYNALQEEPVESVLNGTPLKNGELIEIDDGLASPVIARVPSFRQRCSASNMREARTMPEHTAAPSEQTAPMRLAKILDSFIPGMHDTPCRIAIFTDGRKIKVFEKVYFRRPAFDPPLPQTWERNYWLERYQTPQAVENHLQKNGLLKENSHE